jgi:hypothetical protein
MVGHGRSLDRVLQRTRGVTLDRILCDPRLRLEFDHHAMKLVDERSALKLRWAGLNLRKTHNLKPLQDIETATLYDLVSAGPVRRVDLSKLPDYEGTYVFYEGSRPIYAGETEHLRSGSKSTSPRDCLNGWILKRCHSNTFRRQSQIRRRDWSG